ncbi:DUF455 family protein [Paenibacillus cymbidii]|uniref:DUF455 family protein n=1 Tax=Paenibacillus cymbidii TaxID=1639034 RepID=UPI001080D9D4|nr:DUF455 family protein [Paenibacillus cymbidii]
MASKQDEPIMVDANDFGFLDNELDTKGNWLRPLDTAKLLKGLFWIEFELSRMAMGWMSAADDWDVKGELVRLAYLHTEHMKQLQERIEELPGGGLNEKAWTPQAVQETFLRLAMAPSFASFAASYRLAVGKLYDRYASLRETLDPILEAPTLDKLNYVWMHREQMTAWGSPHARYAHAEDAAEQDLLGEWGRYIKRLWHVAFEQADARPEEWPEHPASQPAGPVPEQPGHDPRYPHVDLTRYKSAMFDPKSPTHNSVKHMIFINASEMSAAESLTYLYYGVQRMPLEFYYDIARHTWDEVRHSQMGVRRLRQMGYRTEDFSWQPSKGLTPDQLATTFPEFYASLTMVMEPCSFIKKRKSIDAFKRHGDMLSSLQSEYDIADERLHIGFGKKWGAKLFEHINDFVSAGVVAEKAKRMHLQKMGYAQEEIDRVLGSFPEFCGFATMDLTYDKY